MEVCAISLNTTDLTGEYGDSYFILNRGDTRIQVIVPLDSETLKLNRDNRFLIDHYGSGNVLSYRLSKPLKLGNNFGNDGIFSFVMSECNTEDDDNFELHIADYYKYFPRPSDYDPTPPPTESEGRKVWI